MSYSGFTLVKEGTWAENIVLVQKFDHQLTAAHSKRNNKAECIWIKVLTSNSEASLNPQGIMVSARAGKNEIVEGTHDSGRLGSILLAGPNKAARLKEPAAIVLLERWPRRRSLGFVGSNTRDYGE
jgi:hypothetical protein